MQCCSSFYSFNIGIYLSAVIPWLLGSGVAYPAATFPYKYFLQENALYFIDCLPILALQYLLGLQYKKFPGARWHRLYIMGWRIGCPFLEVWLFGSLHLLHVQSFKTAAPGKAAIPALNIHYMAVFYFILFTAASFIIYITKKGKGLTWFVESNNKLNSEQHKPDNIFLC